MEEEKASQQDRGVAEVAERGEIAVAQDQEGARGGEGNEEGGGNEKEEDEEEEDEEEDLLFTSASCGFQHTILVQAAPEDEPDIGGKCWAFGSQRYGQLGIIKLKEDEEVLLCDVCNVLIAEWDCESCAFLEEQDRFQVITQPGADRSVQACLVDRLLSRPRPDSDTD